MEFNNFQNSYLNHPVRANIVIYLPVNLYTPKIFSTLEHAHDFLHALHIFIINKIVQIQFKQIHNFFLSRR